jgi:hypothetical protein
MNILEISIEFSFFKNRSWTIYVLKNLTVQKRNCPNFFKHKNRFSNKWFKKEKKCVFLNILQYRYLFFIKNASSHVKLMLSCQVVHWCRIRLFRIRGSYPDPTKQIISVKLLSFHKNLFLDRKYIT